MMNDSELKFVDIDVAKDSLELAMDSQGKTLKFDNDEKGIARLLALILAEESRVGAVVLEATGGFEREAALASSEKRRWPYAEPGCPPGSSIPARRATLPRRWAQRKSIAVGRKVLDKELARIDIDSDDTLKEHFADKLALLKGLKASAQARKED